MDAQRAQEPASATVTTSAAIGRSFEFAGPIIDRLQNLAARYNTTIDKLVARAIATEFFLDDLPHGSKLLVLKPDGKYEEVIRPNPGDSGK